MIDLRITLDGRSEHPLELALRMGRPAAVRALGEYIEALIDAVDVLSGDPDLEEDDPAGDPLDIGEFEDWRPHGCELPRPIYATDQSTGPINEHRTRHCSERS